MAFEGIESTSVKIVLPNEDEDNSVNYEIERTDEYIRIKKEGKTILMFEMITYIQIIDEIDRVFEVERK